MKLKKKIIWFFENIDIFSYPISSLFTFKGKFCYSTVATKVATILVITLSFASFFYFARNYLYKETPIVLISEEYTKDPREIQMDSNYFIFTLAMENSKNDYKPYIDESIYVVDAFLETKINGKLNETRLEMERCQEKHIPEKVELKNI